MIWCVIAALVFGAICFVAGCLFAITWYGRPEVTQNAWDDGYRNGRESVSSEIANGTPDHRGSREFRLSASEATSQTESQELAAQHVSASASEKPSGEPECCQAPVGSGSPRSGTMLLRGRPPSSLVGSLANGSGRANVDSEALIAASNAGGWPTIGLLLTNRLRLPRPEANPGTEPS